MTARFITLEPGDRIEVRLPHRAGLVTITTDMLWPGAGTRMRVDVESDTPRFGPADDGNSYTVENGEQGPGVVFLTGETVSRETVTAGCEGHYDTDDALTSGAGIGEPVYCDGSCTVSRETLKGA